MNTQDSTIEVEEAADSHRPTHPEVIIHMASEDDPTTRFIQSDKIVKVAVRSLGGKRSSVCA
ncbi:MAG: hypothetical protein GKR96_00095 [Gammaproteobacteria bacterium]|nr:hypothetical protein [Gammaproteobacteria bacterium]